MAMLRNVIIFKSSRTFAHIYLKKIHKKFASHKSCIDENSSVTQNLRHTKVTSHKVTSHKVTSHGAASNKSCITQKFRRTKFASPKIRCVTQKWRRITVPDQCTVLLRYFCFRRSLTQFIYLFRS